MAMTIPSDLLRSFIAIVDGGSMIRAAEDVHLTQSAISLQMKRLEHMLETTLFSRAGRKLSLTASGTELAGLAREMLSLNDQAVALLKNRESNKRLRIGCVQDFADAILKTIFVEIFRSNPELMAEVKVGTSSELAQLLKDEELDILMFMGERGEGEVIGTVPVSWYGEPHLFDRATLPLALLDPPCGIRDIITEGLRAADRPYRIVVETRSISALRAAVASGIAVTARAGIFMSGKVALTHPGVPSLPPTSYRLSSCPMLPKAAKPILGMIRRVMLDLSRLSEPSDYSGDQIKAVA
jgi:DNA-binding transcriptional LysR family regulator